MKRSKKITLTLIASISLAACGGESQPTKREVYANKQDCIDDWGNEKDCEEVVRQGTSYYHGPHYFYSGGRPYYIPSGSQDPKPVSAAAAFSKVPEGRLSSTATRSVHTASVVRGGFGASASFHGSGS
ncbi:MAG: hypothetical protein AB1512_08170 [Thermodesulfobacteriota bacterium]